MDAAVELACRKCGRPHDELALVCALCGNVLRRQPKTQPTKSIASGLRAEPISRETNPALPARATPDAVSELFARMNAQKLEERAALDAGWNPWIYLAIGIVTAPVFALTPMLGFMGWFLSGLVHEMGHTACAWLCGMPAIPAISLGGEGVTVHGEQSLLFVAMIAAGLAAAAWKLLEAPARWIALASIALLYPALALTPAKELAHLLAGHAGELAFATLALWKALDGGFTASKLERALYGTVGWFILGTNARLCFGLMRSSAARDEYAQNGSFGLTNDYIRVAEDVLNWPVERVALCMLVACLLVLPAALVLWRVSRALRNQA